MNKDTYEFSTISTKLESYEWDDLWRIHANDSEGDRVFLIGDSISRGYRHEEAKALEGKFFVDNYATSKGIDNPLLLTTIELAMAQEPNCKVIHFNNGLHGFHLSDEEYHNHYEALIKALIEKYPDVKIILGLSTPVRERNNIEVITERNKTVIARNEAVLAIAKKYNLPTTDLYGVLGTTSKYHSQDGVHLTEEGYTLLAKTIADKVLEVI